ncbi:MAG: hypothetical protein WC391_10305 [Methanoregula sp.]|jgi:hypothetical protein
MNAGSAGLAHNDGVPGRVYQLAWGVVLLTVFFLALLFVIPPDTYRFYGNFLEGGIALFCMGWCLYAYRSWSERIILLLAAFAFLGFALSNTFWYLSSVALGRAQEFFSVSELGFLGFMFFFIVAFRMEFPKRPCPAGSRIAAWGLFLIVALLVPGLSGLTLAATLAVFQVLIMALLLDRALVHAVYRFPLLWSGTCLWICASVIYVLRETLGTMQAWRMVVISLPANPLSVYDFLNIVSPLDVLSFLLILLGLFTYLDSRTD